MYRPCLPQLAADCTPLAFIAHYAHNRSHNEHREGLQ